MKIKLFILILLITPLLVSAQVKETEEQKRITKLEDEISSLKKTIDALKKEFEQKIAYQQEVLQTSFEGVSSNLSSASYQLTIFGIGIAVIAIFTGVYVTLIERKIRSISGESKNLLETHKAVKEEVDELNKLIQKNLEGLYLKLKEEETKNLVSRLEKIPADIANLGDILLSRELSKAYYPSIRKSFLMIKGSEYKHLDLDYLYLPLIFQHFADLALFDSEVSSSLEESYEHVISASFENDILKSTEDIIKMCVDKDLKNHKEKIIKYFIAISNSKYAKFEKLYEVTYNKLINKENRFLFYEFLSEDPQFENVGYMYGKLLKNDYDKITNTGSQNLFLKNIDELITKIEGQKIEKQDSP